MIYSEDVKVAPGKPQTGRVKLDISPRSGEAKFSLDEGKKSTGSGFTGSVKDRGVWQTNKGKRNGHILGSDNNAKLLQQIHRSLYF